MSEYLDGVEVADNQIIVKTQRNEFNNSAVRMIVLRNSDIMMHPLPYSPQTNGKVERKIQSVAKASESAENRSSTPGWLLPCRIAQVTYPFRS